MPRNPRPAWRGIGGRHAAESGAGIGRNTQGLSSFGRMRSILPTAEGYERRADSLEILRSALSSLAYITATQMRPVHIHRLLWYTARFDPQIAAVGLLENLEHVREAQRLSGGYWLPTPTRLVRLAEAKLIVSTAPTSELVRRWGATAILRAGVSRFTDAAISGVSEESLEAWLGAPADTKAWTAALLAEARRTLLPADLEEDDLEVLLRTDARSPPAWRRWRSVLPEIADDSLVLCRSAPGAAVGQMFLARVGHGRLTHQSPVRACHRRRIRWGMNLLLGHRIRPQVQDNGATVHFDLLRALPAEEARLVCALGHIEPLHAGGARIHVPRRFKATVQDILGRLGLDL